MLSKIKEFVKPSSRTLTRSAESRTILSKALSKFHYLVKIHQAPSPPIDGRRERRDSSLRTDIILVIGVILISLLSFAMGFIVAKQQEKEPIKIEGEENSVLFFAFASIRRRELCSLLHLRFHKWKLGYGSSVIEFRIQNLEFRIV